jgi:hypothetical protein
MSAQSLLQDRGEFGDDIILLLLSRQGASTKRLVSWDEETKICIERREGREMEELVAPYPSKVFIERVRSSGSAG